jgi:hypothetical protein
MLVEPPADGEVRITPEGVRIVLKGRMYLIAAPSLATAKLCLGWARDFANRRVVDGRPLGGYEEVQRLIAGSAADVFALQAMVDWCLLAGQPEGGGPAVNPIFEQNAAKNLSSVTCWRILERTMSLLAGEGYETAPSKASRGAPPLPLERWYRDARGFRISGGVDFQLDYWTSRIAVLSYYYPAPDNLAEIESDELDVPRDHHLEGRNPAHLRFAVAGARRFARACLRASRRWELAQLVEREHLLIQLSQVANELLAMSLTLARASHLASRGQGWGQDLADVYCTASRHRLAGCWREIEAIEEEDEPDHARVSDGWLGGSELDGLLLGEVAPAAVAQGSGA